MPLAISATMKKLWLVGFICALFGWDAAIAQTQIASCVSNSDCPSDKFCDYTEDTPLLTQVWVCERDGKKWVAFTYGPWALAQETKPGVALTQPLAGKDIPSKPASQWLEPCPDQQGGAPKFRIKGSKILLKPYYSAGSTETGTRTYFEF